MADIFISFKHPEDREKIRPLVEVLRKRGWSVWWCADLVPGQLWHRTVQTELDQAICIVVVWSARSLDSDDVLTEATVGRKRRRLVQVTIEHVSYPSTFEGVQSVDLTGWDGNISDVRFEELCAGVGRLLEADGGHIQPRPTASARVRGACNMFYFQPEEGNLYDGIGTITVLCKDQRLREVLEGPSRAPTRFLQAIGLGKLQTANLGNGDEVFAPLQGQERNVIWASVIDPPVFDASGRVVEAALTELPAACGGGHFVSRWRPGAGIIVRVDTGLWGHHGGGMVEDHGSISLYSDVGGRAELVAGEAMGNEAFSQRSALWRMQNGSALLVKGSRAGTIFRLFAENHTLRVHPATDYQELWNDIVERRRGAASASEQNMARETGTVKDFDIGKGGLIRPDRGGEDIVVEWKAVVRAKIGPLEDGMRISFELEPDERGRRLKAVNLRPAE